MSAHQLQEVGLIIIFLTLYKKVNECQNANKPDDIVSPGDMKTTN